MRMLCNLDNTCVVDANAVVLDSLDDLEHVSDAAMECLSLRVGLYLPRISVPPKLQALFDACAARSIVGGEQEAGAVGN